MDTQQAQTQMNQAQQITRTMTLVEEMHTRLFGNGQPGELDKLSSRIDTVAKDVDELQKSKAHAKGVVWALSSLVSMFGLTELWHLLKK